MKFSPKKMYDLLKIPETKHKESEMWMSRYRKINFSTNKIGSSIVIPSGEVFV